MDNRQREGPEQQREQELETRLTRVLQEKARRVQFTPAIRARILEHLSFPRPTSRRQLQ